MKFGTLDTKTRVRHGRERERQIAHALTKQAGLPIFEASQVDDQEAKIDRWIDYPTGKIGLQIKYREAGDDLLFEVYDKWFGWDDPRNKLGRDMMGNAKEYAVLLSDRKTVVMVPTESAKKVILEMEGKARVEGFSNSIYHQKIHGFSLQLRVQKDPANYRQKMIAYISPSYFVAESQAKVYQVFLPKKWKS